MRFYGIKREKIIERIRYERAKLKTFLAPYLEMNKEKREIKKEWYNRIFQISDGFTLDRTNSIPEGKYFIPVSIITIDLIAKEDISLLKEGIRQLILKNTSHKFIGTVSSLRDINDSIDNLDENLFSNNAWLNCGRFDFSQSKKIKSHIDYFDLKLINFSTSYIAVEIHIYLAEDRKKQIVNIINQNYRQERGSVFEHYSHNSKVNGAKKSISVQHFNNSFLKSELLSDLIVESKWYLYNEVSKYFPFVLHKHGIIPPSLNLYKTNLLPTSEEDQEFWDSVGGSWYKGQSLSSSETIFFEPNISAKNSDLQRNDILLVINDDNHPNSEDYYSFDYQVTLELSEKSAKLFKLIIVRTLNSFFTRLGSEYRNKVNEIKMKKRFLKKLLKMRFLFEKDFILFRRINNEIDWEKEEANALEIFPRDDTDESKIHNNYRVITEFPLKIQERVEKVRLDIKNALEQKITITGHINDYINSYRNFRLNIVMLIIAGATFTFVLYPESANKVVSQIDKIITFFIDLG